MPIFLEKFSIEKFRKLLDVHDISVGKKITVISGMNGVGKSNILSLIASSFGKTLKRASGGNFQPLFTEYFKLMVDEDLENYGIYLKFIDNESQYSFTKRLGFKDDIEDGRGIRIIPRTHNHFNKDVSVTEAAKSLINTLSIGASARVPIPTIFVSLSRLFPLGETDIKITSLRNNNDFIKKHGNEKYKEWYNFVLPNSIKDTTEQVERVDKNVSKTTTTSFYMPLEEASVSTQSIGQDNLRHIISALVDFYILSNNEGYNGGVLCIDELDASLHPSAQINLFSLLEKLSEELQLQIFVSTHSLTILQEIITKENLDKDSFRLIYLKNSRMPFPASYISYDSLKADLFDETSFIPPEVKVYCEDITTNKLFNLLLKTGQYMSDDKINLPRYQIIPLFLGCNQLLALPKHDSHFKKVCMVLDGDARSDVKIKIEDYIEDPNISKGFNTSKVSNNVIFLPSFLAPESFLYAIIWEYVENERDHLKFWRNIEKNEDTTLYTSDKIKREIIDVTVLNNNSLKKKSDQIFEFVEKSGILFDYYSQSNNKVELENFIYNVTTSLNSLSEKLKSGKI